MAEATTERAHGTYVKYVIERCRCERCKEANREYERNRNKRKTYGGKWWGWVDAEPARQHVLALMSSRHRGARDGIGLKRIARLAGVPHGSISKLIYGGPGERPPSRRIKAETERKLLSVRPVESNMAPRSLVEAEPVWRMVEELVAFGMPKSRIALAIGKKTPALQINRRGHVRADNARAIAELHWRVYEGAPAFRAACSCYPPREVMDRIERQADAARPKAPHALWGYPSAHRAKLVASRMTEMSRPCVVTREERGGATPYFWYPAPPYVPPGAEVVAVVEDGEWKEI